MERQTEYEEISIKELILTLYKQRRMIIAILLITVIMTLGITIMLNNKAKKAQILIDISHSKISSGKNPDGSKFDPYDIVAPFVLKDVVKELEISDSVSINDIRKNISIDPIIPESVETKKEYLLEKEGETLTYYPNEFLLKLDATGNIDENLSVRIANQIVDSYTEYFTSEYINAKPVTNRLINFDIDDYDYSDISKVLHRQLTDLVAYNTSLYSLNETFRSKETGFTFYEIGQTIGILDKVNLNRIDSLISAYKLTKDKEKLSIYYKYMIEKLTLEKAKLSGSNNVSKEMLKRVEGDNKAILQSVNGELEDSQNSYFNQLILRSSKFGTNEADIQKDINYYEQELSELNSGSYINSRQDEVKEEVETVILSTTKAIKKWIEITNDTSKEFYEKLMTKAVRSLSPAEIYSDVNVKLNLAIGLVLGLMVGVFGAFLKAAWID